MAIYTKKGDKGETGLFGGSRIAKNSLKVNCYGTLDEANASLGIAYSLVKSEELKHIIRTIQQQLFIVGAELASDDQGKNLLKEKVNKENVAWFEQIIDQYEQKLGPIYEFIIPGETTASACLHLSRSMIRRAERLIVKLNGHSSVRSELIQYVNRLSDVLFMLARAEVYFHLLEEVKSKVAEKIKETKSTPAVLTLELACQMAKAAEEKAAAIGIPIVFSVADSGGNTILIHRMEEALLASLDISPNKAYTAVALKMATHELVPLIQPGGELYGVQLSNQNKIVTFGGGYPLKIGKQVVGGIGVSGGSVEEDMTIAVEALKVFNQGG
ncbi:cob(I)yrinic acid a,c-diamide adenosyltransferase [Pseudobacillus sp. FSL P4-0506]|uniref:cob(I)yrinic acid a,c-diamide adenosyltransferase n=1 Tax=unclassified Pseudobacillus TaxID=2619284 RepID=UPI0030F68413